MTAVTRVPLILMLLLALSVGVAAQTTTATETTSTAREATVTAEPATSTTEVEAGAEVQKPTASSEQETGEEEQGGRRHYQVRNEFDRLLSEHAWEFSRIVKLDPALLSNEKFMAGYPDIADYLALHPEIRRNPRFYLGNVPRPDQNTSSALGDVVEIVASLSGFALAIFALSWLIRMIVEQRRWNRLTRTQTEVHNKILDRFASSEELMQYINTPAGSKFLESAPIALQVEHVPASAPVPRLLRSLQAGVIVAVGAVGMFLVSLRFKGETSEAFFAMGVIAFFLGIGFIASGVVAMRLSRRLATGEGAGLPASDEGLMR